MPNLKQHTDLSGTFGTLGLGTVEAIRIKDSGEVVIPNLPAKLDTANAFGVGQAYRLNQIQSGAVTVERWLELRM